MLNCYIRFFRSNLITGLELKLSDSYTLNKSSQKVDLEEKLGFLSFFELVLIGIFLNIKYY